MQLFLVAILNDLVTMVLGTDNTNISYNPERWNMQKLIKISLIFTIGWVLSGMLLFIGLFKLNIMPPKIGTIMFLFLIFSAMLTILMTRTGKAFEKGKPSKMVLAVIINQLYFCFSVINFWQSGISNIMEMGFNNFYWNTWISSNN